MIPLAFRDYSYRALLHRLRIAVQHLVHGASAISNIVHLAKPARLMITQGSWFPTANTVLTIVRTLSVDARRNNAAFKRQRRETNLTASRISLLESALANRQQNIP